MFEDERRSVGRPKLADTDLKKKSLLIASLCIVLAMVVLFTGAYELNIIRFGKLKGTVECNSIPDKFRPYDEDANPNGIDNGFTDVYFYNQVVNTINGSDDSYCSNDSDITLDSFKSITNLEINNENIQNIDGVENLKNLKYITIRNDNIENVNLYYNLYLSDIKLNTKNLTNLRLPMVVGVEVPQQRYLTTLEIYNSKLESIDLKSHISLESLSISNSNITNLDLGKNTLLSSISINNDPLTSLSLKNNKSLSNLVLYNTSLSRLDLSDLKSNNYLTIDVRNNPISEVSFPYENNIKNIDLRDNKLTNINLNYLNDVENLQLENNNISSIINTSSANKLKWVYLDNNQLTNLDLKYNNSLVGLNANNNKLNDLQLPSSILRLSAYNNNLTNLNLTGCLQLSEIDISNNDLTEINTSKNTELTNIGAINNNISKLDLTNNKKLVYILADNNNISEVKGIEGLSDLALILINNNKVKELDLTNNNSLVNIGVDKNDFADTLYFDKNQEEYLNGPLLLNGMTATIDNEDIIGYENDQFVIKDVGETNVSFSDDRFVGLDYDNVVDGNPKAYRYTVDYKVVVYELATNGNCIIDKSGKQIDAKGLSLDKIKINITGEGLTGIVEGNKYIIKDGDNIVKIYDIVNYKDAKDEEKEVKKETNKKSSFDISSASGKVKNTMSSIFVIQRATDNYSSTNNITTTKKADDNVQNFITGNDKIITINKDDSSIMIILIGIQAGLLLAISILLFLKRKKAD